jgi:hypothetical protein
MNNQITKQQNSIQTIQNPIFDLIINEVSVVKKKIVDYVNQSAGSAVQKKSDMIKNIE